MPSIEITVPLPHSREQQLEIGKMIIAGYILACRDKGESEDGAGEFVRGVVMGMNSDFRILGYKPVNIAEVWPLPEAYITIATHVIETGKVRGASS